MPTTMDFFLNKDSSILDVVLHGSSLGIESTLIQEIIKNSKNKNHSVLAFNFPFIENGLHVSSGDKFPQEMEMLDNVLNFVNYKRYEKINFIGKSLGGLIGTYYIYINHDSALFSINILGFINNQYIKKINCKINIIQGQYDKFGNIENIKNYMKNAKSKQISYKEVKNSDHSFRDHSDKEKNHEKEAIKYITL